MWKSLDRRVEAYRWKDIEINETRKQMGEKLQIRKPMRTPIGVMGPRSQCIGGELDCWQGKWA